MRVGLQRGSWRKICPVPIRCRDLSLSLKPLGPELYTLCVLMFFINPANHAPGIHTGHAICHRLIISKIMNKNSLKPQCLKLVYSIQVNLIRMLSLVSMETDSVISETMLRLFTMVIWQAYHFGSHDMTVLY